MKVANSLRSLKTRHRDCQVVRRKGRVYVINKTQKRYQGPSGLIPWVERFTSEMMGRRRKLPAAFSCLARNARKLS